MHNAGNAAVDLENGGGGGGGAAVTVETRAYPADKRLKEKQPFTWLGASPCIAAVLVSALFFAAGIAVIYSGGGGGGGGGQDQDQNQPYVMTARDKVGTALFTTGTVVAMLAFIACATAGDEGCCGERNLLRLDRG